MSRNALIMPSLLVIGATGAIKSGAAPAVKYAVQISAAKSGGAEQSYLAANGPTLTWSKFAIWGGGVAALTAVSLALGDTDHAGDVVGALLALAAGSAIVLNWAAISAALNLTGAKSSSAATQAANNGSVATPGATTRSPFK